MPGMTSAESYAGFLPEAHREHAPAPTSTWWQWRDSRVHTARSANPGAQVLFLGIHGAGVRFVDPAESRTTPT